MALLGMTSMRQLTRTFQPVTLKVLPALLMVTVRSHMPGRVADKAKQSKYGNVITIINDTISDAAST